MAGAFGRLLATGLSKIPFWGGGDWDVAEYLLF